MIEILERKNEFTLVRFTHAYRTDFGEFFYVTWLELQKIRKIIPNVCIKAMQDTYNNRKHLISILNKLAK